MPSATATLYPYCELVAFGDFHASQTGEFSREIGPSGLSPLGERLLKTARWINTCREWRSNAVLLNNGDFTSVPGLIDAPTNYLLQLLQKEFSGHMPQVINLGNHDIDNKVGLNNLHILDSYKCQVVPPDKVTEYKLFNGLGPHLFIVPFTFDIGRQRELLDTIPDGSIVAIHTPVIGAHMSPEVRETSGIPIEYFRRFRLTISSHYHLPQIDGVVLTYSTVVNLEPGMFIGMGAPLARTFSDTNPVYGIWGFDFTYNKAEFIANPHSPIYTNELPTEIAPGKDVFVSLDLSAIEADTLKKEIAALPANVRVRVRKKTQPSTQARSAIVTTSPIDNVIRYLAASNIHQDADYSRLILGECLVGATVPTSLGSRVEFHQLRIENFFSFDTAELNFAQGGLTFVSGVNQDTAGSSSNGSGKSSLFEALVWCLYDQTLRDLEEGKDSLIRKGQDRATVSVDFSIEGKQYTVTRSRSKGKPSVSIVSEGQDLSRGLAPAANQQILTLLGIPYNVFIASTFFTNSSDGRFSLMTDANRKKFLASALGEDLSIYETIKNNLSEKVREHDRVLTFLTATIQASNSSIEEFEAKYLEELEQAVKLEQERELAIAEKRIVLVSRSKEFGLIKLDVEATEKSILEKKDAYSKRVVEATASTTQLRLLRRNIETYRNFLAEVVSELDKSVTISEYCTLCEQPLPEAKIQPLKILQQNRVGELQGRQDQLKTQLDQDLLAEAALGTLAVAELPPLDIFQQEQSLTYLKGQMNNLRIEVTVLNKEINDLQAKDYRSNLKVYEKCISDHKVRLAEATESHTDATRKEVALGTLMSALSPTGVVSYILDATVDELNSYLESYGKIIFSGDYTLSLSSTKNLQSGKESNKITLQYTTEGGSYGLSSSGEKRKADIALFLALNMMLTAHGRGTTNLMVADEALDSLDPVAASVLVEGLLLFAKESGKSVYLTSHSGDVTALVDQSIIVTRQNGVSRCTTIS